MYMGTRHTIISASVQYYIEYLPSGLVEHVCLLAGSLRVDYHQAWPNDDEGTVYVERIGFQEREGVHVVLVPQVMFHPLNTKIVGHLQKKQKQ